MKTKEQKQQYNREYYKKNRERCNEKNKIWQLAHPDWQQKFRETHPNYQNEWNKNHPEQALAIWKRASIKNVFAKRQSSINWNRRNIDKVRIARKNRIFNFEDRVRYLTHRKFKREQDCGICHTNKNLHFHHWVYKLPVERKHFSTLCNKCHNVQHKGVTW